MIYGATGYTGNLIAEEAVLRGQRPILAGRDAAKVQRLAETLRLKWVAFSIEDHEALLKAADSVDLILNTAGPFSETAIPLMDACLAGRTHYLDIANEISVLHAAQERHRQAEERGVSIISGVGFGTVASSGLVRYLFEKTTDPVSLEIAIVPFVAQKSIGAAKSTLEVIANGGYIYRGGMIKNVLLGFGIKPILFADGLRNMMPVLTGDLEAAYMVSGIPDITVYMPSPLKPILGRFILPIVHKILSWTWLRHQIGSRLDRRGMSAKKPLSSSKQHSHLWARIINRNGHIAEAWLKTGEGYAFTATASVLAVEWVFEHRRFGVFTAAPFGENFVLNAGGEFGNLLHT
jgi:short subunit dehydrogenase-like uncharacterized protein